MIGVTETMAAATFLGGSRVAIRHAPIPSPSRDELLVRVSSCALCGTDGHAYRNGGECTPGHEIAGTVQGFGEGVDEPPIGTPGVVYLVDYCGACVCCRNGWTNLCTARGGMYGLTRAGGFAEYLVVRARCFLPIDPALSPAAATALLDLFGTTVHAFRRAGGIPRAVAVLGCGPIGLGAIAVARCLGAARVYGVDVIPYRLRLAATAGATPIDAVTNDPVAALLTAEPDGCDVVIEAAGRRTTQRQAIELTAAGGRVVIIAHNPEPVEVHTTTDLIQRERALLGSEYFPVGQLEEVQRLMIAGRLDPAPLQTHRFPLERLDEACAVFWGGDTGKVMIEP
jgi:propanol-preferring alcohol dehydrogenase